jgi:hypothetical protein
MLRKPPPAAPLTLGALDSGKVIRRLKR